MRHFHKLDAIYTSSVLVRLLCCSILLSVPQAVMAGITIERVTQSTTTNAQLELEASYAKGMTRQARVLATEGKTAEALLRFEEINERFKDTLATARQWQHAVYYGITLLYHAELLTELKQYEKALANYRQVIKLYGHSEEIALKARVAEARSGRSDLYALLGKTAQARAGYQELLAQADPSPGVEEIQRAKRYLSLPEEDLWSGKYRITAGSKDNAKPIATNIVLISKLSDKNEKDVAARYRTDLARWQMSSPFHDEEKAASLQRFLFDDESDEYQQFGWTQLFLNNKMECMDGRHFFFCKTEPGSTVRFNKDESYTTKTGIFGILRRYGVFELEKLK